LNIGIIGGFNMNGEKWFNNKIERYKNDVDFLAEQAIISLTERIVEKMESANISRAELAKRLGVSKAMVTKILNGNPNLTIKTIVSIANAMNCKMDIDLYPVHYELRKFFTNKTEKIDNEFKKTNPSMVKGISYVFAA